MAPAKEEIIGQSEGSNHAHSRNVMAGKGMSKEVDAKATSDPYQNNASQAHNTKGATANDTTNDSSNKAASNAPHGGDGHGPSSLGSLTSSMPVSGSMRSMMMPVGAGVLGFGASTIALKSLPPTSRMAAAAAVGALAAFAASRM